MDEDTLDPDSTLLNTYGHQEGEGFNFHYQDHGYHPLVCYDGITGDLLKIQLRNGTDYSSTGVMDFLQPLLDEFGSDYPEIPLFLRGDSGFTKPELYHQCETNGVSYTIRLKLLRIAAKVVHSARYITFKLCSSCLYKNEFYETLENIRGLRSKLE